LGVEPVSFNASHWPGHEPKDFAPFAAAWATGFMQYAAMGGVEQVAFDFGNGPAESVLKDLQPHGGQPVRVAESSRPDVPVSGFSIASAEGQTVWVANPSTTPVQLMLEGLGGVPQASLTQLSVDGPPKAERAASIIEGRLPL